ncbi:MAG: hypothetical protein M3301_05925 [Chloroflexota bacterium]|nr:hypothetical protein [Chloroflexota bacterium]
MLKRNGFPGRRWGAWPLRRLCVLLTAGGLLVAFVAGARQGGSQSDDVAAAAVLVQGSFSQSNSRDGSPIFTVTGIAPGESVTGKVTIANTGTLSGAFTLVQQGLHDTPGPNGGALSGKLDLLVRDVTSAQAPVTVYSGKLGSMSPRRLGVLAPRQARSYSFTASFPEGGAPPTPAAGDNAFAASALRVNYLWQGVQAAPPADRPPRLGLRIPRVQRILRNGYLVAYARCNEPCRIKAYVNAKSRGRSLRAPSPLRSGRVAKGKWVRLRIRLAPRSLRGLRRALARRRPMSVYLTALAQDDQGNQSVVRRTVKLKPRRRR